MIAESAGTSFAPAHKSLSCRDFRVISHPFGETAALNPGLLAESIPTVLAQGENREKETPDQVMATYTVATSVVSLPIGCLLIAGGTGAAGAPWARTRALATSNKGGSHA